MTKKISNNLILIKEWVYLRHITWKYKNQLFQNPIMIMMLQCLTFIEHKIQENQIFKITIQKYLLKVKVVVY
jgi:hypothetical protein